MRMTSPEKIAGPLGTDGCLEGSLVLEEAVSSAGPILSLCEAPAIVTGLTSVAIAAQ